LGSQARLHREGTPGPPWNLLCSSRPGAPGCDPRRWGPVTGSIRAMIRVRLDGRLLDGIQEVSGLRLVDPRPGQRIGRTVIRDEDPGNMSCRRVSADVQFAGGRKMPIIDAILEGAVHLDDSVEAAYKVG
jgi:hypothetical protein